MDPSKAANNNDLRGDIKEFAAGVSVQTQVANRVWLAFMTVAFVAVLPHGTGADKYSSLSLPFGLGHVDPHFFYPVVFYLLVVLAVAFAAAHAQVIRAGVQVQRMIDLLHQGSPAEAGLDARERFDIGRIPSLNRVAPLAQLAIDQLSAIRGRRWWVRILGILYYILLKLLSILVYYGLPVAAVTKAYANTPWIDWGGVAFVAEVIALAALMHVFLSDSWYSYRVVRQLWRTGA